MTKARAETVHLVPTGTHYIPGVPAIEQDVTPERAAELLAYRPAAFTTTDAPAPVATTTETPEDPADPEPAVAPEPKE